MIERLISDAGAVSIPRMAFDWKDGGLVAFGFAVAVVLQMLLRAENIELSHGTQQGLIVALLLSPSVARRAIFGAPVVGARRDSLFYRLASILGLFGIFFGTAIGFVAAHRMSLPSVEAPDWLTEEARESATSERIEFSGEDAEDGEAILRESRAEAALRTTEWEIEEQEQTEKTWLISAVALVLFAIGSFLLSLRYEAAKPKRN